MADPVILILWNKTMVPSDIVIGQKMSVIENYFKELYQPL